jgi:hypothetical protein
LHILKYIVLTKPFSDLKPLKLPEEKIPSFRCNTILVCGVGDYEETDKLPEDF